jgi:hypothetical protein
LAPSFKASDSGGATAPEFEPEGPDGETLWPVESGEELSAANAVGLATSILAKIIGMGRNIDYSLSRLQAYNDANRRVFPSKGALSEASSPTFL